MESKDKIVYFGKYCKNCVHENDDPIESVCHDCLNIPARENSHKPEYFEASTKNTKDVFKKPKFIKDYLYLFEPKNHDYDNAYRYFNSKRDALLGGCSVVRNGNYVGRNLDWYYDNTAEFIVRVPSSSTHYSSIGICGGLSELSNEFVKSGEYSPLYDILPFQMYDGVNEHGLFAEINVVPTDYGENVGHCSSDSKYTVSSLMLIRFILDNFESAKNAVTFITKHCTIYFPQALHDMNYECHYMIADRKDTYILEFINNRSVAIKVNDHPYMTNFHISNVIFNPNGTVMTPENGDPAINRITKYGSGLERYNLIVDNYDDCGTAAGMREMCNKLKYSQTYLSAEDVSDPFWYTEYVGGNNTVSSPVEQLRATAEHFAEVYENRIRGDHITWHSTHSVVYDLENLNMNVIVQEDVEELNFSF